MLAQKENEDLARASDEPPITLAEKIRYWSIDVDGEDQVTIPSTVLRQWADEVDALERAAKAPT